MGVAVVASEDLADLTSNAARLTANVIAAAQKRGDGFARVVFTGGGAGIGTLVELRKLPVDWSRVHVFFGDERNVPVSHPDSNEGQARAALLDHVDIPEENIHGWGLGERSLELAAHDYENIVTTYAPDGFTLHLVGMGHEGHINSLFPYSPAVREQHRLAVAVTDSPKPPAERGTLTLPAVNSSEQVWLLVSGEEKTEAARRVIGGLSDPEEWPAVGARGRILTQMFLTPDADPVERE